VQLAFTTVEELFALLEQAGEPLDYRELWPHLFPVANCPPGLMHALVDDIVRHDERFFWESDVHLGLAQWRAARRDLAEVVFTVVDLETTGATPGFAKITEIGAVRVERGEQTATFSTLVDPGVPIPRMIADLTGIDDEAVAGAPPITEALPRFVEFAEGTILVAHNARFDLSFLDYELTLLCRQTFQRPAVDTLRLARKLCPQQRCSLGALAERFDTVVKPQHRALHDAQATAELLVLFLARLEEQGVSTLEEVARFCEPGARRNYHKIALTEQLPAGPGVYVMRDRHGHALYIGKADNLRRRTRDHFLQRQAYGARQALELLERFEVVETGSEFGALLLEQRLIARHRPLYNQHGTRVAAYHYVKLTADDYPRVYATPNLRDDGGLYAGPFRTASVARRFIDCLTTAYPLRTCVRLPATAVASGRRGARTSGRRSAHACTRAGTGACLAPCRREPNGSYGALVDEVRAVLRGEGEALDTRLADKQAVLVERLAFEQAQRLQHQRELAERVLRTIRRLEAAVREHAVLVYPARARGRVRLFGVRAGAVVLERDAKGAAFDETAALAFLTELAATEPPARPLPADRIDEVLLVHGWLQRHGAAVNVIALDDDLHRSAVGRDGGSERLALAGELVARVRLCGVPAEGPGSERHRRAVTRRAVSRPRSRSVGQAVGDDLGVFADATSEDGVA
jgi:DNA polymerase-3 subunit epsilon